VLFHILLPCLGACAITCTNAASCQAGCSLFFAKYHTVSYYSTVSAPRSRGARFYHPSTDELYSSEVTRNSDTSPTTTARGSIKRQVLIRTQQQQQQQQQHQVHNNKSMCTAPTITMKTTITQQQLLFSTTSFRWLVFDDRPFCPWNGWKFLRTVLSSIHDCGLLEIKGVYFDFGTHREEVIDSIDTGHNFYARCQLHQ
jgi:hypothetical protein